MVVLTTAINQINKSVVLTVKDAGNGVTENELEEIFKPFYRANTSEATRGYGLGLAIAKQIIESHAGTVTAENIANTGLQVTIVLPVIE